MRNRVMTKPITSATLHAASACGRSSSRDGRRHSLGRMERGMWPRSWNGPQPNVEFDSKAAPPAALVHEFDNMAPQPNVKFDSKSRQSFASDDGSQELACTSSSSSDDALVIQFDSDGKDGDDDVASDASSEILAAAAIKTEAGIMARDDDQKMITSAQTFTSRAAKPTSKGKLKIALDLAARPKSKRALVKTNQSWFTKWCACRAPQVHEPCENQT